MTNHEDRTPRSAYNPIRLREDRGEEQDSWATVMESRPLPFLVGLLFATIFGIAWTRPQLAPVTVVVLAGCLLYRLGPAERRLAAAPVVLATARFGLMLIACMGDDIGMAVKLHALPLAAYGHKSAADFGIPWIPAFLSVCLFYLPRKNSVTLKIVAVEALAVILSSLLPGEGFAAVLAVSQFTLFFVIGVGLLFDLKPNLRELFTSGTSETKPIRVHIPAPPPPRPVG